MADKRIFPAIDIIHSGTRREELLLDQEVMKQIIVLRRIVSMLAEDSTNYTDANERLIERLSRTQNNAEFLATLSRDM